MLFAVTALPISLRIGAISINVTDPNILRVDNYVKVQKA